MDARITKSRLSNLLSYDWLKICATILAAVLCLWVFFTMVKTRPGRYHTYSIYGYRELLDGSAAEEFTARLESDKVFSYDVLKIEQETFGTGQYSETAIATRRSADLGTVMFTTVNPSKNKEGITNLQELVGGDNERLGLDTALYLQDCENYLIRFFGEDWRAGELDEARAERCFNIRNDKDKRFRSEEKKRLGVEQEKARLYKLRDDFAFVYDCFESGLLSHAYTTDANGNERASAVALGKLSNLRNLYYYMEEKEDGTYVQTVQNVCLLLFRNDEDAGVRADLVQNDLRYETISFLRYLVERFGA